MISLLYLTLTIGLAPLIIGTIRLQHSPAAVRPTPSIGSILQCVLAFNLTFFCQELGLVLSKALVPGLHPILFHNDHSWSGDNPLAELLQGAGAVATAASGLLFYSLLRAARAASVTTRLFFFWMAFQGLFQSLTQVAIGTLIPGNDLGRALAYLGFGPTLKGLCLGVAVALMAVTGRTLAARFPADKAGSRSRAIGSMLYSGLLSVPLIVPFRVPRSAIEVVLVPLIINLIGTGWLILGASMVKAPVQQSTSERSSVLVPALACCVILIVFQLVLRPGIRF